MINKIKIFSFIFCVIGVFFYNIEHFFYLNETKILFFSIFGLFFSFTGLSFYISGIKKRIQKKIRMCPKCFFKNEDSNIVCIRCSNSLI